MHLDGIPGQSVSPRPKPLQLFSLVCSELARQAFLKQSLSLLESLTGFALAHWHDLYELTRQKSLRLVAKIQHRSGRGKANKP
jgi:hypothetical protein